MKEILADTDRTLIRVPGLPPAWLIRLAGVPMRLVYEAKGQLGLYLVRPGRPLLLDRVTRYLDDYQWTNYARSAPVGRDRTIEILSSIGYLPSVLDDIRVDEIGKEVSRRPKLNLGILQRRKDRPEVVIYAEDRRAGHVGEPSMLSVLALTMFTASGQTPRPGWGLVWEHDARGGAWVERRVPWTWGPVDGRQAMKVKNALVRMGFGAHAVGDAFFALLPPH